MLEVEPARASPGEAFRLRGEAFARGECDDVGPGFRRSRPDRDVPVSFEQGSRTWELATVDADRDLSFEVRVRVPAGAELGKAVVKAEGSWFAPEKRFAVLEERTNERTGAGSGVARAAGVFFPEHEAGEVPAARLGGMLALDREGCVRLRTGGRGPGETILWSPEYAPETRNGTVLVLDGRGREAARTGEKVIIVGGYVGDSLEGISGVDERTRREAHERCPGSYIYAGPVLSGQSS